MKKFIKKIKLIRRLYDIYIASRYFNHKYFQIIKWAFNSNEDTNYTYNLSNKNKLELLKLFEIIFKNINYEEIKYYLDEIENDHDIIKDIKTRILNSKYKNFTDLEVNFSRRLGWYICVRILKPKTVVETGVDKGLGSLVITKALMKNKEDGCSGYYYGTDINPDAGYLFSGNYKKFGKILYGDSIKSLKKIEKEIDLFINDSDHSADYEYSEYQTIRNKLSKNAIILVDNSHVTDRLLKFSIENKRNYIIFKEEPLNHWYPGAGIGISYPRNK